ncbi:MAG: hypothetical protein ACR2RV_07820 [Verrucomicrobiales bacterium]
MIDRLSTFSDPKIIRVINDNFIPVAENDWFQRRRQDAVGEFFRGVADQGPRKGAGGSTRQGHYALTADGKLLAYNNNRGAGKHAAMLESALKKWEAIPAELRAPGAVKVADLAADQLDQKYARAMPPGTVVLKTSTRLLKMADGHLVPCGADDHPNGWGHLAAHNQMWLQAQEIAQLRGLDGEAPVDLPAPIAYRMIRFHLLDNTRGEPNFWGRDDISKFEFTVRAPDDKPLRRLIEGRVLLEHADDRGFDAKVLGYLDLDPEADRLTAAEIVAVGDHWGSGTYTRGARPGRSPLGIAFSLADMENDPGAKVPPQGSGWLEAYLNADRH